MVLTDVKVSLLNLSWKNLEVETGPFQRFQNEKFNQYFIFAIRIFHLWYVLKKKNCFLITKMANFWGEWNVIFIFVAEIRFIRTGDSEDDEEDVEQEDEQENEQENEPEDGQENEQEDEQENDENDEEEDAGN